MKIRLKVCTAILLALLAASRPAAAQFMPEGILRWGGNSEGGAPFIFYDPADPERLTGIETEVDILPLEWLGITSDNSVKMKESNKFLLKLLS